MFDYYCEKHDHILSFIRNQGETIVQPCGAEGHEGEECEYRQYFGNAKGTFDVAEGLYGNAKTGYNNTIGSYHPSSFTPLSKAYGKSGRSSWFNKDGTMG